MVNRKSTNIELEKTNMFDNDNYRYKMLVRYDGVGSYSEHIQHRKEIISAIKDTLPYQDFILLGFYVFFKYEKDAMACYLRSI